MNLKEFNKKLDERLDEGIVDFVKQAWAKVGRGIDQLRIKAAGKIFKKTYPQVWAEAENYLRTGNKSGSVEEGLKQSLKTGLKVGTNLFWVAVTLLMLGGALKEMAQDVKDGTGYFGTKTYYVQTGVVTNPDEKLFGSVMISAVSQKAIYLDTYEDIQELSDWTKQEKLLIISPKPIN